MISLVPDPAPVLEGALEFLRKDRDYKATLLEGMESYLLLSLWNLECAIGMGNPRALLPLLNC